MLFPKPARGSHKRRRRERRVSKSKNKIAVRARLIPENVITICICCKRRRAESIHEVKPESVGGVASDDNSIPVCGSGTTGCHGHLQRYNIRAERTNDAWTFTPTREVARRWMTGAA